MALDRMTNLIAAVDFDQRDLRQHSVNSVAARGCKWLTECKQYQRWVTSFELKVDSLSRENGIPIDENMGAQSDGTQLLWIKGKPGVGKSTLMKFAVLQAQERCGRLKGSGKVFTHFFHARGVELERSIEGLYRTFLVQLLESIDAKSIDTLPSQLVSLILRRMWTTETLQELIEVIVGQHHDGTPMMWFIDALDECEARHIREMLRYFTEVLKRAEADGQVLHLCLASRHYPEISINTRHLQITVESEPGHLRNISSYIDTHLDIGSSDLADEIRHDVQGKSQGVFMWTCLVVDILCTMYDRSGTIEGLPSLLDHIPPSLGQLFGDILKEGLLVQNQSAEVASSWKQTVLCLQLVHYRLQPLSLQGLCWALSTLRTKSYNQLRSMHERLNQHDAIRFIHTVSRGLVECVPSGAPVPQSQVQFIHQSVPDFLSSEEGFQVLCSMEGLSFRDLAGYECYCHGKLRDLCADELFTTLKDVDIYEGWDDFSVTSYPFLDYAGPSVLRHSNEQQRLGEDQQSFLRDFDKERYLDLHLSRPKVYENSLRHNCPTLEWAFLLSKPGLHHLLESCQLPELAQGRQNRLFGLQAADKHHWSPLRASYSFIPKYSYSESLRAFIRIHLRRVQKSCPTWYPMLKRLSAKVEPSFQNFDFSIQDCILDLGIQNPMHSLDWNSFFLLATSSMEDIGASNLVELENVARQGFMRSVRYLLFDLGLPLQQLPFSSSNLLLRTCLEHDIDTTRWLINNGASVNARGFQLQGPLHFLFTRMRPTSACVVAEMMQMLLDAGTDVNAADVDGYTAFHVFVMFSHKMLDKENHWSISDVFVQHNADLNARDPRGMTVLHHAIYQSVYIINRFLQIDELDPNIRDHKGRTALHHVCKKRPLRDNIKIFLRSERVDVHIRDAKGKTAMDYLRELPAEKRRARRLNDLIAEYSMTAQERR